MSRRMLAVFAALAMILMMVVPAGAAPKDEAGEKTPAKTASIAGDGITSASAGAIEKIHSNLLSEIRSAGSAKSLQFVARIAAGTDLSAYSETWFARSFTDPLGSTVASGFATPNGLLKMAADPGVIKLQRPESLVERPAPNDPDVDSALNAALSPAVRSGEASPGPAPEGWFSTGGALHGSQAAWDKGYTGEGVRYMSNDSGADYCHADLEGTWAYIDDPGSPYHGLPEMFDSISSYYTAFDYYVGTTLVAEGLADYADTSATAGGDFSYAPLGAAGPHDYTVPGTSLSGTYHYGSHVDKALADVADILSGAFGDGTAVQGERAGILVVDEHTAGVYDTVYVDLNYDFDFTTDTPARLGGFSGEETACLDYDLDGLNDVSGGLVYYISDGTTGVPTHDWFWGIDPTFYGNGDLVAFHVNDFLDGGGTHGMGTTSVAVGQGRTAGSLNVGPAGYPIAGFQGLVVGPGKDVASTQNGDQYLTPFIEDAYIYSGLGYDAIPGTGDDVQIVSNSWGFSGTDNDGFDFESRLIDAINRDLGPTTALLFSTGNGAAGYGTSAPPSPASGISIGASTEYGSIGSFEAIASADQIVGGDVMTWSNRGPGVRAVTGVDVVATGAFGTGDVPLNGVLWGAIATESFGGTSMSAPVAAGNLALIYQAWKDRTGVWPTFQVAKELLTGSATDTGHDVWSQGSGLVNADVGTDVAAGLAGVHITPTAWSVGDYRGAEYPAFANVIVPGGTDTRTFTLNNFSGSEVKVKVKDYTFDLIKTKDYSFTSLDQSMDHGNFTTPDYAFRIDKDVPKDTDLLQIRVTKPFEQFAPDGVFGPYNNWRVHLQNWTDLDGDGKFWVDTNGNGKVDLGGEMETGEHIRFSYGYNAGPSQQVRIADPHERIDDGLLLTFRHRDQVASVPTTDLGVEASFWKEKNWDWLTIKGGDLKIPAGGSATFTAEMKVDKKAEYGMYEGSIEVGYEMGKGKDKVERTAVIPVTVAVSADGTTFDFGTTRLLDPKKAGKLKLDTKKGKVGLYDNGFLFGYTDYTWRAESGDWRFFFTDIRADDLPGSGVPFLVVDNQWLSPGTDVDTIVLGPTPDGFGPEPLYGPYTLEQVGRSANAYVGSGIWGYQTSSGGPREIVAAPLQEGLHSIMLHQVRVDGDLHNEPFGGRAGLVTLDQAFLSGGPSGSATVTISSELTFEGFVADGYGLAAPEVTTETAAQDDPNDPSSASVKKDLTLEHAGQLTVSTALGSDDLDLFLVFDADEDGVFTNDEIIASSTTATSNEFVGVSFPADGDYQVWVQGWSVTGTPDFELTIDAVQGFDITVDSAPGAILAGGNGELTVSWDITGRDPGTYGGVILFGPLEAPGLFSVPIEVVVP